MSGPVIPGIRRIKEKSTGEFFYFFNLAELTEEVAFGLPGHQRDSGTHRDFWSDDQIARMLFDPGGIDGAQDGRDQPMSEAVLIATEALITGCDINDKAIAHGRHNDGFNSTMTDGETNTTIGPTILAVPEAAVRSSNAFAAKYRQLATERTYWVKEGEQDVYKYLDELNRKHVESVRFHNKALAKEIEPLKLALGRMEAAHMAVGAMLDFAAPPAVRRERWASEEPKEQDSGFYEASILLKPPTSFQITDARHFQETTLGTIVAGLSETLSWMVRGDEVSGKIWPTAKLRNSQALRLLEIVREDAVILRLFDEAEFIHPVLWARLEVFLVEAFQQIATCPEALSSLLDSELMAIAKVVSRGDIVVPTDGVTSRQRELAHHVNAFVPDNEIVEKETPLSKRLSTVYDQAKVAHNFLHVFAPRGTVVRLWSMHLSALLERFARGVSSGPLTAQLAGRAWLFRSIVGAGRFNRALQKATWNEIYDAARSLSKHRTREFLNAKSPLFKQPRRRFNHALAWEGVGAALSLFAIYEAVVESEEESATHTLGVISAGMQSVSALSSLAETVKSSPTFVIVAPRRLSSVLTKVTASVKDTPIEALGPVAAWLTFVGTVLGKKASLTASQFEKDKKNEAAIFAALGFLLSVAQLARSFHVAGMVLLVGQVLIENREKWMSAMLPNIEALPGVGRFVRGAWKNTKDDTEAMAIVAASPWRADISDQLDTVESITIEASAAGDGIFWRLTQPNPIKQALAAALLKQQYGLSPEASTEVARA